MDYELFDASNRTGACPKEGLKCHAHRWCSANSSHVTCSCLHNEQAVEAGFSPRLNMSDFTENCNSQRLRAGKTMQELEPESSSSARAALCPPPAPCIISYTSSSHSGLHAPLTTPLPGAITGKGHRPLLPQGMLLNCRKVEIYRKLQRIKIA